MKPSAASLPPILFHIFNQPLPYTPTLSLQNAIHAFQLDQRRQSQSYPDVLLLLQHQPTYTAGRRQISTPKMQLEEARLQSLGADWVYTSRGGETTYHGPGQIVGYPLLDLGRMNMSIRSYICKLQIAMEKHILIHHNIKHCPSEHTGLFLSETEKLGSIGVQVRHRLTTHGFAFNITSEPEPWFNQVVACGLPNVRAISVETFNRRKGVHQHLSVHAESQKLLAILEETLGREIKPLLGSGEPELMEMIIQHQGVH